MEKKTWIIVNMDAGYELVFKCEAENADDAFNQWEQSPGYIEADFIITIFSKDELQDLLKHFTA